MDNSQYIYYFRVRDSNERKVIDQELANFGYLLIESNGGQSSYHSESDFQYFSQMITDLCITYGIRLQEIKCCINSVGLFSPYDT